MSFQQSHETATRAAFRKAGIKSPDDMAEDDTRSADDELLALGVSAWMAHPHNSPSRRMHVVNALRKNVLMYRLIEQTNKQQIALSVGWLLNTIAEPMYKAQLRKDTGDEPVGGGQVFGDAHTDAAPVTQSRDGAQPQAVRRSEPAIDPSAPIVKAPAAPLTEPRDHARPQAAHGNEPARMSLTPIASTPAVPPIPSFNVLAVQKEARQKALEDAAREKLKVLADKHEARGKVAVATQVRLSRLDTVMVWSDGVMKKIGDCTVREVRIWSERRQKEMRQAGRDMLFAMNLIANLPSNVVLRDHWKDTATVDRIYENSEAEYAA